MTIPSNWPITCFPPFLNLLLMWRGGICRHSLSFLASAYPDFTAKKARYCSEQATMVRSCSLTTSYTAVALGSWICSQDNALWKQLFANLFEANENIRVTSSKHSAKKMYYSSTHHCNSLPPQTESVQFDTGHSHRATTWQYEFAKMRQ